jgi:transglutaminase-like putative cysteine protease
MGRDYVYEVSQTVWFDRYAVETKIDPDDVAAYDEEKRLYRHFVASDDFIPADNERIRETASARVRWENNPYRAAERLYGYVVDTFEFPSEDADSGESATREVEEILDTGVTDAYGYATIYCALLRSAGIPARPVSGLLVYGDKKAVTHHWVEFYLEEFGWVPVDPVLGDNSRFEDIPAVENPREYYFGNLDNRHIAFSKGVLEAIRIKPDGDILRRDPGYALQTIHEEVSPDIRSYRTVWQKPRVVDWW